MKVRDKGHNGEREFANLLEKLLGIEVKRNVDQVRDGGADIELGCFAIEVKRQEQLRLKTWQKQAISQVSRKSDLSRKRVISRKSDFTRKSVLASVPVLAYRQNRKPWRVMMLAADLVHKKMVPIKKDRNHVWIEMDVDYFIYISRLLLSR